MATHRSKCRSSRPTTSSRPCSPESCGEPSIAQYNQAVFRESLESREERPKIRSTSANLILGTRSAQKRRHVTHLVRLLQVDRLVDVNLASGGPVGGRNPSRGPDRATIRHMDHVKDPERADPPLRAQAESCHIQPQGIRVEEVLRNSPSLATRFGHCGACSGTEPSRCCRL